MSLNHAGKRPSVARFINPIFVDILIISDIFLPIFKDLLGSAFDKQEVRDNSSEQKRSEKSPRRFELRFQVSSVCFDPHRVGKSLIWGSILQHKIQRPGTYVIQMRKKSSELLEKQSLVACKYLAASSLI
ncbi:hypothetical protein ACS0TY_028968 [Phlomoides rotata]